MELANKRITYDVSHYFEDFTIQGEATYSMGGKFMRFNGTVNDAQGVTIGSIFYNVEADENISVQFNVREDLINVLVGVTNDLIEQLKAVEL